MNAVTRFEIMALAFKSMTGHMAPGKDSPCAAGPTDMRERFLAWLEWTERYGDAVNAAIRAAESVLGESVAADLAASTERTEAQKSPWRPASEPPALTEWVLASADGAVRCVAWNREKARWEDWDNAGAIALGEIKWWMPIPETPKEGGPE